MKAVKVDFIFPFFRGVGGSGNFYQSNCKEKSIDAKIIFKSFLLLLFYFILFNISFIF